ncbi:hypothetical protein BYT27DRAFT_7334811 [Phlegmacium glaucopus]|nr:hypothetical protein BYT27DRAFT_7334811 [Phlegmacium glaucopus]
MVQITSSLLVTVAAVIPALAHLQPLARREDTDIVGSAFSRRFYDADPIVVTRDVAVGLQERDFTDAVLHPKRTWKEHRRKKEAGSAAKAQVDAEIKQEHSDALGGSGNPNMRREYLDLQERDLTDAVLHPKRTWKEHRRKKAAGSAAKAQVDAEIKQEHSDALGGSGNQNMRREYLDLQERDLTDTILHPKRTWKEHRRKEAAESAAEADVDAKIKQEHANALGANQNLRREYVTEYLAERSFDEFDLD